MATKRKTIKVNQMEILIPDRKPQKTGKLSINWITVCNTRNKI